MHIRTGDTSLDAFRDYFASLDTAAMLRTALRLAAVLLCLTVHETCHALAAYAMGDETAKSQHRISLNPLHHIDWLGLAAMLLLGFGWAKPVQVDMRRFPNPKLGMALTALAGPVSNLLFALLALLGCKVVIYHAPVGAFWEGLFTFLQMLASLNVGLGVFNLIPISPLDGSKVLFAALPDAAYEKLMYYERYGFILLYALIFFGALDGFLTDAVNTVFDAMVKLVFF
ncbi:MAG: site-2 protease family protein [Ruminococcaceae bacterium]|nr:site-2 protease family protein [Oscillospiraceae bacterium]